ncbi:hypothetical protein [Flavivirga rizhaonensis]|uniref:Uncharacterized protein n=1 Tax=Flavivirga rizhaonensis TaxID=2559571 RepID=A0A4S1DWB2_9FLAO|nr:hypothetical protein [Flavivirga rizhaonensis]TGV01752.1 hypothetical protein EM932_13835 [Flavivirga rizhaonensis]
MEDINTIYYNNFGIAFQWKRCAVKDFKKIQLVFRGTGLLLTSNELMVFSKNIDKSLNSNCSCIDCMEYKTCKSILVEAPNQQTTFAMTYTEIKDIQDLVKGTLFQMGLNKILNDNTIK